MTTRRPGVLLIGYGPTAESALRSLLGSVEVIAVVRDALDPFTFHQGRMLLVHRAAALPGERVYAGAIPGRVVGRSAEEGWIEVLTGRGILRVHEVSRPEEPACRAADLVRSCRVGLGLKSMDLLRRIGELETRLARLEARGDPP